MVREKHHKGFHVVVCLLYPKLHGLSPRANYTDRQTSLVLEVSANSFHQKNRTVISVNMDNG
jgi:hypothetical protein